MVKAVVTESTVCLLSHGEEKRNTRISSIKTTGGWCCCLVCFPHRWRRDINHEPALKVNTPGTSCIWGTRTPHWDLSSINTLPCQKGFIALQNAATFKWHVLLLVPRIATSAKISHYNSRSSKSWSKQNSTKGATREAFTPTLHQKWLCQSNKLKI